MSGCLENSAPGIDGQINTLLSWSISHSAGKCLATTVAWEMQRSRLATTLKMSPFSAKKIAHWTNLGSMANPLLPKTLLPIMLPIVASWFLLSSLYVWLQAARRIISAAGITEQGISTTVSLRGSVRKERPFSSGWLGGWRTQWHQ